jgi:hypothetical protein
MEKKYPKLNLVNPFYDEEDGKRQDVREIDMGRADRYEKLDPGKVVTRDLQAIHDADGTVAIVDGALSYGTIMEIAHTFLMGRLVYIIVTNGHINHPWFQFHGTRLFESYKEFEHFIEEKIG